MGRMYKSWERKIFLIAFTLLFIISLSVIQARGEGSKKNSLEKQLRRVSLAEAVGIALEKSLSLKASELAVKDSRLALSQAEAENLINPNPAYLLQAEKNLEIAIRTLAMERYSTTVAVTEAFYSVLKAADYVDIGGRAIELAERQLAAARSRFAAGAGTQSEVMDHLGRLAAARADLAKAKGSYDLALLNFRRTLGLPLDSDIAPEREEEEGLDFFEEYLPDLEEDIKFALSERVEVLQAEAMVETARAQVGISRNDYTPDLVLQRALTAEERARNGLEQLKYGIELEIRQAYLVLRDLSYRIEAERENLAAAEENLRIARKLLEAGMGTSDQVMAAEVGVDQVRMNLRHAIYDYNLARLKYDRAAARPLSNMEGEGG